MVDKIKAFLIEIEAYDTVAGAAVIHRFGEPGFVTLPTDTPPNAHYAPRIKVPGDYSRTMFSDGKTSGSIDVAAGVIELINLDGGLDVMSRQAFSGRTLRILTMDADQMLYANATVIFVGTIEQPVPTYDKVTFRFRDRLAELDVAMQTILFAGTTTSGSLNEAEGTPDSLKGQPKPLAWGAVPMIAAVPSNTFANIFDLGQNGLQGVANVWDKGVALTSSGVNYANVAALKAATVPMSQYATCLSIGLIKTGSSPIGQVTAAPLEGSNAAARTAAQIARRMLLRLGKIEGVDFLSSDILALDAANSAVIGFWSGTEDVTHLDAMSKVLNSIGATIVPDRLGRFRMFRMEAPSGSPVATFTKAQSLEASARGIERKVTADDGNGVPTWKVTLNYGHNGAVMTRNELEPVQATDAFKNFAQSEWRTAVAQNPATKVIHKLATDLTFDTYLVNEADATAEANRLLALHGVPRERYSLPVKSYLAQDVDIGSIVAIKVPRFGLDNGKIFRVIGIAENFQKRVTTLDIWG